MDIASSAANRARTTALRPRDERQRDKHYGARLGVNYPHTVIDDHSRVAYAEIRTNETADTAVAVLQRATAWFAERSVTIGRVLSDIDSCYRSYAWRDAFGELNITHKRTRPYRPHANGKIKRFHHTLADGWAHARDDVSETARRDALQSWLHFCNCHRAHSAIGGHRQSAA